MRIHSKPPVSVEYQKHSKVFSAEFPAIVFLRVGNAAPRRKADIRTVRLTAEQAWTLGNEQMMAAVKISPSRRRNRRDG
jgi:hypothetical protein